MCVMFFSNNNTHIFVSNCYGTAIMVINNVKLLFEILLQIDINFSMYVCMLYKINISDYEF